MLNLKGHFSSWFWVYGNKEEFDIYNAVIRYERAQFSQLSLLDQQFASVDTFSEDLYE